MLDIKVIGPGCRNCELVERLVRLVCAEQNLSANIEKVTDRSKYTELGIWMTPGLIINGRVVSQGKIPTKSTLTHWLTEAIKEQAGAKKQ